MPFISNLTLFEVLLWILCLLTRIILIILNCMLFSFIDPNMQGAANGLFNFCNNLFGLMPAPFVYAAIQSMIESK